MIKRLVIAVAALAAIAFPAFAGEFSNYPNVAGSAKSCSTVNSVQVCTVPAGPTALTGSETIPADTNLSGGRSPQTVNITTSTLGAGPTTYLVPLTGEATVVTNTTRRINLNPAGTIAAFTVTFPAATTLTQADGQLFGLCTTQIVTALTVTAGAGTTVLNGPTALLVPVATGGASCVEWQYRLSNTTWYRVQ